MPESNKCPRCGAELPPETPGGHCISCLLQLGLDFGKAQTDSSNPLAPAVPSEKPGDRISRYKLLQQIGEGGWGVVYMAEQEEPVRRRVAFKIIKLGMDTRQVIARFEAERQALALMEHPNISKVLDAGATETGRPYFVMELVRGIKITDYCDQNELSTRQRLELFVQVCQAVQHAHQKGIIHRDLKPSNILVTEQDGKAVPKVIDFGIAKATTGERLTDKTLFTAFEQFIGTPAYMSPEQAGLGGLDIDTRSDIYSLGVLLYELLAGQPPFNSEDLRRAALDEILRTIREKEPRRPSARLTTLNERELTTVAKHRQTNPEKLVHLLCGDLDWIVMKALEKDRTRRYETANGFASDIQRHLNDEPVVARPPSRLYEFQKTVQRHKFGFTATAAVILALALGLGAAIWTLGRERQERERVEVAELEQRRSLAEAQSARSQAEIDKHKAEQLAEQNRLNLYAARIRLADQATQEGDIRRAQALLESVVPVPGETDLRSFDWYYLSHSLHSERLAMWEVGRLRQVAFSPDGLLVAVGGDSCVIHLIDTHTKSERGQLLGHTGGVAALAFLPDGRTLVSAAQDGTVRLWDVRTLRQTRILTQGTNALSALAISSDGKHLAIGEGILGDNVGDTSNPFTHIFPAGSPGRIFLWNLETLQFERELDGHPGGVWALNFAPNSPRLASVGIDHRLTLQDSVSGQILSERTNSPGASIGVKFTPDGRNLAVLDWNVSDDRSQINILDADSLVEIRQLTDVSGQICSMALSPNGAKILTGYRDGTVRLLSFVTGDELALFTAHEQPVMSEAFSPDGKMIATAGFNALMALWDIENSSVRQEITTSNYYSVAFSPDGTLLASAFRKVELYHASTGALIRQLPEFSEDDGRVAFSPDGSILAAVGCDTDAHFWATKDGRHWTTSAQDSHNTVHKAKPYDLDTQFAFSPDSRLLARGGYDHVLRIWDARTGRLVDSFPARDARADSVAFTPDGKSLITGEGQIYRWDLATKEITGTLPDQRRMVRVSYDGRHLAALYRDKFQRGNRIVALDDLPEMRQSALIDRHQDEIWCMAFSHDNQLLATGSWDGTVKIWQVATGDELMTLKSNSGRVWSVAFSPQDDMLAFGCGLGESGKIVVLRNEVISKTAPLKIRLRNPEEMAQELPVRATNCPANLLDLSSAYNGLLTDRLRSVKRVGSDLASLPVGAQTFNDTMFDVRGMILLNATNPAYSYVFPVQVTNIPVHLRCLALHFFQGATGTTTSNTVVGEYVIHYADNQQLSVPILYGEDVVDWWQSVDKPLKMAANTHLGWQGQNADIALHTPSTRLCLFDFRWENPRPDEEITSIDFKSAMTSVGPFLLAVTAE